MRDILPDLERWVEAGERIALATVIQTWGSSPRGVGAKMAITSGGEIAGSVSGGCVEAAVVQAGLEALKSGQPQLLHFGVADETAWGVGLACGGTIEVLVKPLDGAVFSSLRAGLDKGLPMAHLTVIRGPEPLLGREVLFASGERIFGELGGHRDQQALAIAALVVADRHAQRHVLGSGPEQAEVFVDVMFPPPTLVIVGGVHIALALTTIAHTLGYRTVIIDPRGPFGSSARFAHADRLIQAWPQEAFSDIQITPETAVCSLVHDPKIDDPALKIALGSPAFYVGALGSRGTQARRRVRLLEAGVSESQLARLHTPIGLDIGAVSPEEIALAIMAEVVAARHRKSLPPAKQKDDNPVFSEART
jgi:xanthine dehydrogenase accessory factor